MEIETKKLDLKSLQDNKSTNSKEKFNLLTPKINEQKSFFSNTVP